MAAVELSGRGIRVVGIAPGLVETALTREAVDDPEMRKLFMAIIPTNRAVEAREIVPVSSKDDFDRFLVLWKLQNLRRLETANLKKYWELYLAFEKVSTGRVATSYR